MLQMQLGPEEDESKDFVRILTALTIATERFDSMVGLYRKALERHARPTGDDWSEQITLRAADLATFARQALEQLRRYRAFDAKSPESVLAKGTFGAKSAES